MIHMRAMVLLHIRNDNMKFNQLFSVVLGALLACASQISNAHAVKCGNLNIAHPYSTPTLGVSKTGAAYFMAIKNNGKVDDQLMGAKSDVSSSVEIHKMVMENDSMKMRAVPEVQLPAGYEVTFKHGQANGYHLMLIDLKKPLKEGDKFPLVLKFKRAGECQAEIWVEALKADAHKH